MKKTFVMGVIAVLVIAVGVILLVSLRRNKADIGSGALQVQNQVGYVCKDNKTISATFDANKAFLVLSDRNPIELTQTVSADGARYANADESFVFWTKGNGALVLENNAEKSYIGCIHMGESPAGADLRVIYRDQNGQFLIRLPSGSGAENLYTPDPEYFYQVSPAQKSWGVKFTVPASLAEGTNLSKDSYISVETISQSQPLECTAQNFSDQTVTPEEKTEYGTTYSFASTGDAGAGNRYDQMIYAIPGTKPCVAIRYFIHYTNIGNYEPGTIKEFDRDALIKTFDAIRSTLILNF